MFNNDTQDRGKQIQAINYEHVELQAEIYAKYQQIKRCENTIDHFWEGYVNQAKHPGLDNEVMVARKHTSKYNKKTL